MVLAETGETKGFKGVSRVGRWQGKREDHPAVLPRFRSLLEDISSDYHGDNACVLAERTKTVVAAVDIVGPCGEPT